jgi:hypothetical protein
LLDNKKQNSSIDMNSIQNGEETNFDSVPKNLKDDDLILIKLSDLDGFDYITKSSPLIYSDNGSSVNSTNNTFKSKVIFYA